MSKGETKKVETVEKANEGIILLNKNKNWVYIIRFKNRQFLIYVRIVFSDFLILATKLS